MLQHDVCLGSIFCFSLVTWLGLENIMDWLKIPVFVGHKNSLVKSWYWSPIAGLEMSLMDSNCGCLFGSPVVCNNATTSSSTPAFKNQVMPHLVHMLTSHASVVCRSINCYHYICILIGSGWEPNDTQWWPLTNPKVALRVVGPYPARSSIYL